MDLIYSLFSFYFICQMIEAVCEEKKDVYTFGDQCDFMCHCKRDTKCDGTTGNCRHGCASGWYGPGCQYRDIAEGKKSQFSDNSSGKQANDGNQDTCGRLEMSEKPDKLFWTVRLSTIETINEVQIVTTPNSLDSFKKFNVLVEYIPSSEDNVTAKPKKCFRQISHAPKTTKFTVLCNRPVTGNSIRIELAKSQNVLELCDVKINGGRNLAFKGSASQISWETTPCRETFCRANLSVDGLTTLENVWLCSYTDVAENPWWKVDIGFVIRIWNIQILSYNRRANTNSSYLISVSNDTDVGKGNLYTTRETATHTQSVELYSIGRVVKIIEQGENQRLTVCEVFIFGDCPESKCGFNCEKSCDYKQNTIWDKISGLCLYNCEMKKKGYLCNGASKDDDDDGDDDESAIICSDHCFEDECNPKSGKCTKGCKPGWEGEKCKQKCTARMFGVGCKEHCPSNCKTGTCHHVNGTCLSGCKPGYQGNKCREKCVTGKFGEKCKSNCSSNCKSGTCDHVYGKCFYGCKPGYRGDECRDECSAKTFGEDCKERCSSNCKSDSCHHINGRCLDGCSPGYKGNMCREKCDDGFYGENCESVCGYCKSGTICNHVTGTCYGGCKTGFTGDACLQAIQTSNSSNAAAAGSVVGLVIIIIVAFIVVVLYKRRGRNKRNDEVRDSIELTHPGTSANNGNRRISNGDSMHAKQDENDSSADETNIYNNCQMPEQTRNPIPLSNLLAFVKQNLTHPQHFADEFKEIPYGMQKSSAIAKKSCNRGKNRYKDMHAYDESRVVLKTQPNERGTDYINASFIKGHHKEKAYIAAQGPIEASVRDFWRMIWQKDVYTIAMVTNLAEETKMKCLQYWPPVETRTRYGYITVYTVSEFIYADFTIRNFRVLFEGKSERNIRQFHFTSWPDKSVPSTTSSLLQFWRKVRKNDETKEHTWLVHCSAGVGRTGTFIATDILYDQGKDKGYIDVYQCVKDLRDQRVNMVQTKDQYVYLHTLMVEALILASEPAALDDLHQVVRDLKTFDQRTRKTRLLLQYETLKEDVTPLRSQEETEEMYSAALREENKNKNRFTNILPLNIYRPLLVTNVPGCTHYINAVNLPSYAHKLGYIITQKPLENTVIDYYRLIYEQNVKVIVTFPDNDNGKDRVGVDMSDVGPFTLKKVSEEDKLFYTKRIFNMAYSTEDTSNVTQLEFKNWNENRIIPSDHANMLYFMQEVEFLNRVADGNSVLVQCLDGSEKSGLFVALMNIVEHARLDNEVSIPQVIRQLRSIRQQIIPNFEQFQFCYDALICYIDSNQMYANM